MDKEKMYDDISDIFEYGEISIDKAITMCNNIIKCSLNENDENVLESMYHAIFICLNKYNISKSLNLDILIKNISHFNSDTLDYIISIISYTGEKKYLKFLKCIGESYNKLDIEEAINELNYRYINNNMKY